MVAAFRQLVEHVLFDILIGFEAPCCNLFLNRTPAAAADTAVSELDLDMRPRLGGGLMMTMTKKEQDKRQGPHY